MPVYIYYNNKVLYSIYIYTVFIYYNNKVIRALYTRCKSLIPLPILGASITGIWGHLGVIRAIYGGAMGDCAFILGLIKVIFLR